MTKDLHLRNLIDQCFDIFNIYGKKPESAKNILNGFKLVLSEFDEETITDAFKEWMKQSSTMPTPSDIYKIIKPPVVWDKALYMSLVKRRKDGNVFMSSDELKYIEDYEREALR